jgi:hypothetical protein
MFPRFPTILFALVVALLIIFGTFGIFSAEASSFQEILFEARSDGAAPVDAYTPEAIDSTLPTVPGLPY